MQVKVLCVPHRNIFFPQNLVQKFAACNMRVRVIHREIPKFCNQTCNTRKSAQLEVFLFMNIQSCLYAVTKPEFTLSIHTALDTRSTVNVLNSPKPKCLTKWHMQTADPDQTDPEEAV